MNENAPLTEHSLHDEVAQRQRDRTGVHPIGLDGLPGLTGKEYAPETRDPAYIPFGPSLGGDDVEGIISADMVDSVLSVAQYLDELPGIGTVYSYDVYAPYRELERDPKIFAALENRATTAIEHPWHIEPGGTDAIDIKAAEMLDEHLDALDSPANLISPYAVLDEMCGFDQLQYAFSDANLMGFAAGEVMWEKEGSETRFTQVKMKKQHRFRMHLSALGWQPRLITRLEQTYGLRLPPKKFLFYRHRPQRSPFGMGLAHQLYYPVLYKRKTLESFLIHGQRYASPTVFIPVPNNATKAIASAARDAASRVGIDAAITIPFDSKIQAFEAKVGGNSTYDKLLAYIDAQIAQVLMGQTGTMDQTSDGGSRAQDEVADLQTLRKANLDSQNFAAYMRRNLFAWDVQENLPGAKIPRLVREFPELEESSDELAMSKRDETIVSFTGKRLEESYVKERYGVTLGEEVSNSAEAAAPNVSEINQSLQRETPAGVSLAEGTPTQPGSEKEWVDLAMVGLTSPLTALREEVISIVRRSLTPEEMHNSFVNLMIDSGHVETMANAIAPLLSMAYGLGMVETDEEAGAQIDMPVRDRPLDGLLSDRLPIPDERRPVWFAEGLDPVMGFDAALEGLRAKVPVPTQRWDEILGDDQAWAFTVAGIASLSALEGIQDALDKNLAGEGTFTDFQKDIEQVYANTGTSPLKPWRVRLLLNQNTTNAYQAGRYERAQDAEFMQTHPVRVYRHGGSDDPREAHIALDGFVAPSSDPIWRTLWPPNGFGCNCRVFSLTQGQADREGLEMSKPLEGGNNPVIETFGGAVIDIADTGFTGAPTRVRNREKAMEAAQDRLTDYRKDLLIEWFAGGSDDSDIDPVPGLDGSDFDFSDLTDLGDLEDGPDTIEPSASDESALNTADIEEALEYFAKGAIQPTVKGLRDKPFNTYRSHEQFEAAGRAAYADVFDQIDRLEPEFKEREAKYQKVRARAMARVVQLRKADDPAWRDLFAKVDEQDGVLVKQKRDLRKRKTDLLRSILDDRLRVTTELETAANNWVSSLETTTALENSGEDTETIRRAAHDFYVLTRGAIAQGENTTAVAVKRIDWTGPRANANNFTGTLNAGSQDSVASKRRTIIHELGHFLEFSDAEYTKAVADWRNDKATSLKPEKLSETTSITAYGDREVALPDDYISPYVGKVYAPLNRTGESLEEAGNDTFATEVLAMGIQHFASAKEMQELYDQDRSHFFLTLGILTSKG